MSNNAMVEIHLKTPWWVGLYMRGMVFAASWGWPVDPDKVADRITRACKVVQVPVNR